MGFNQQHDGVVAMVELSHEQGFAKLMCERWRSNREKVDS